MKEVGWFGSGSGGGLVGAMVGWDGSGCLKMVVVEAVATMWWQQRDGCCCGGSRFGGMVWLD